MLVTSSKACLGEPVFLVDCPEPEEEPLKVAEVVPNWKERWRKKWQWLQVWFRQLWKTIT